MTTAKAGKRKRKTVADEVKALDRRLKRIELELRRSDAGEPDPALIDVLRGFPDGGVVGLAAACRVDKDTMYRFAHAVRRRFPVHIAAKVSRAFAAASSTPFGISVDDRWLSLAWHRAHAEAGE